MSRTFEHHDLDDKQADVSIFIRFAAEQLEHEIMHRIPETRERSLAMTNLEQSIMWANKAIAIHGIKE